MKETDQDYVAHVESLIGALAQDHALGRDIDIGMCVSGLEPGRFENRKVREFVTKTLKIPGKDFDRALHLETIKAELGSLPKNARHFVEACAAKKGITARYNGVLQMNEVPYITNSKGEREYVPPHLWETYEFKTMIRTNFRRKIGFAELQQEFRVRAAELRLEFHATAINDASELWYNDICRNRLWRIMGAVDYVDDVEVRDAGQESLRKLAETCFHCPDGVDVVVATFNKFIWQVKRKVEDMPIYDHLMPVILGSQGTGKSTLIRNLLEPIEELWLMSDFKQITDDRNISLWRNYVVFLDEMGWASKSDMDTVKNIITAQTMTRRVMRTNVTQEVAQNVTFIGASNATALAELIRDATGTRRFLSLTMLDQPDRAFINTIDWTAVWQSVDQSAPDPMLPFRKIITRRQETERMKTTVEEWLDALDDRKSFNGDLYTPRRFTTTVLHTAFREFEEERFPGPQKTSMTAFARELGKHVSRKGRHFICFREGIHTHWGWAAE